MIMPINPLAVVIAAIMTEILIYLNDVFQKRKNELQVKRHEALKHIADIETRLKKLESDAKK